jgi:hypothetical protein
LFYLCEHIAGITETALVDKKPDKYAFAIAQWSYKALTNATVTAREDLFYGLPARYMF